MSVEAIARRYAQALFDLGVESNKLQPMAEELQRFAAVYQESEELRAVVDNPLVAEQARDAVIEELASRLELDPLVRNTVRLLSSRHRMAVVPEMARALLKMSDVRAGLVRAQVVSAKPLSEDYASRLRTELEALSGKKVIMTREVDPSLLAGVVTRIGDMVIDGSLKTRLSNLRAQLLTE